MEITNFGYYFIVSLILQLVLYSLHYFISLLIQRKIYIEAVYKNMEKKPIYKINTTETCGYEPYEFLIKKKQKKHFVIVHLYLIIKSLQVVNVVILKKNQVVLNM